MQWHRGESYLELFGDRNCAYSEFILANFTTQPLHAMSLVSRMHWVGTMFCKCCFRNVKNHVTTTRVLLHKLNVQRSKPNVFDKIIKNSIIISLNCSPFTIWYNPKLILQNKCFKDAITASCLRRTSALKRHRPAPNDLFQQHQSGLDVIFFVQSMCNTYFPTTAKLVMWWVIFCLPTYLVEHLFIN